MIVLTTEMNTEGRKRGKEEEMEGKEREKRKKEGKTLVRREGEEINQKEGKDKISVSRFH